MSNDFQELALGDRFAFGVYEIIVRIVHVVFTFIRLLLKRTWKLINRQG